MRCRCVIISLLVSGVTMMYAQQSVAQEVAAVPAAPVIAAAGDSLPGDAQALAAEQAAQPIEKPKPPRLATLLFSSSERMVLNKAKNFYSRQGLKDDDIYDEEDLLRQLQGIKLKNSKKTQLDVIDPYVEQFYLESIIYHAPNDWTVRVREGAISKLFNPLTSAQPNLSVRVVSISKEQVTFEWKPLDWERVKEVYKEPSAAIHLDEESKLVIFSLMVNQTLFSYDMTLREGVMKLVPNIIREDESIPMEEGIQNQLPEIFGDGTVESADAPTVQEKQASP